MCKIKVFFFFFAYGFFHISLSLFFDEKMFQKVMQLKNNGQKNFFNRLNESFRLIALSLHKKRKKNSLS